MAETTLKSLKPGMVATVIFTNGHIIEGIFEGMEGNTFQLDHMDGTERWWRVDMVGNVYRDANVTRRILKGMK